MQSVVDSLMQQWGVGPAWTQWMYAAGALAAILIPFAYVLVFAGVFIFLERRIAGRMQSRIGPNRVGPQGLIQWVADALKVLFKEDLIPADADHPLFKIGPLLAVLGIVLGIAVVPFGGTLIGADLDVGLLFLLSVTSLVVCGVLMSGWASNSKWSLFGGLRSAAQIVSYEIPHATALLVVVMLAGTMSINGLATAQGWLPWDWFATHSPFALMAFVIYFIAALAEGSRVPFDLPEAESELVAGYTTEYSGWRFLLFYLAELANVWIMAVLAVVAFLGGGNIPTFGLVEGLPWYATATPGVLSTLGLDTWAFWTLTAMSFVVIFVKTWVVVFVISQLRWTLPRIRVDQMMSVCWKVLVPLSFVAMLAIMVLMHWLPMSDTAALFQHAGVGEVVGMLLRLGTFAFCLGAFVWYVRRVAFAITNARDKVLIKFAL
ncbi:MAG: complex I subunit 1 family protein [Pseudomonadota bacterium]